MERDVVIQTIFEIADDSLQGVLGCYFYTSAIHHTACQNQDEIKKYLPTIPERSSPEYDAFPMTFSWARYYKKQELIDAFKYPFFELYQTRLTLTAITNIFDDLLQRFVERLVVKGHHLYIKGREKVRKESNYKKRIEWAFCESFNCTIGDNKAIARLPRTFGIIDEARRLRNLIVHNHGIFNQEYEEDTINSQEIIKVTNPDFAKFKELNEHAAIIVTFKDIIKFSQAHIEVLHVLHNQIQLRYFGHNEPYDYRQENKSIMWDSAFWGNAKIDDVKGRISAESYLQFDGT